jgi:hypothetical protein
LLFEVPLKQSVLNHFKNQEHSFLLKDQMSRTCQALAPRKSLLWSCVLTDAVHIPTPGWTTKGRRTVAALMMANKSIELSVN